MRGGLKYVPCQKVPTRGWESLLEARFPWETGCRRQFPVNKQPPLSALPGFLDQAKLIFFRFRQLSTFKAMIAKWNRAIFVFTPRQTGRWVGSRALPVQNPPISALVVVGLRSTVKSGNSTLNGLGCHKSLRSVGLVVQQWRGGLIIGWALFGLNRAVFQPKLSAKHSEICFCFGSTLLHYCWCCYVILSASRSSRCWEKGTRLYSSCS